ncbi:Hypothetical protein NTJ_06092 [Nesidiocoris tenuis]|uniref:Uncharacterized protein n=1 Tax=Nesidiocoris tenuis TaxID=355587 RepID=A0ABN7AM20_9HEMI|nr:Hypothetical protein NTJ_06092 [Nesidiocoris tenuis]
MFLCYLHINEAPLPHTPWLSAEWTNGLEVGCGLSLFGGLTPGFHQILAPPELPKKGFAPAGSRRFVPASTRNVADFPSYRDPSLFRAGLLLLQPSESLLAKFLIALSTVLLSSFQRTIPSRTNMESKRPLALFTGFSDS